MGVFNYKNTVPIMRGVGNFDIATKSLEEKSKKTFGGIIPFLLNINNHFYYSQKMLTKF